MACKRLPVLFSAIVTAAIAVLLFCSKDYNPFDDLTNARVHVLSWCFPDMDSVSMYSTGTIKTVVALSEDVDSFKVSAGKNRFFSDTVVRRRNGPVSLNGGPFLFPVSFFDTGLQTVTVMTFRSNGEVIPEEFSIRAVSPLHQPSVQQIYGVPFRASTPGVADKDVQYHWNFGPGREISSLAETCSVTFTNGQQISGKGAVWVTDLAGMHASPADSFAWSFSDTSKPVIFYFDDAKKDTIFTGDSIFVFRVHIIDNIDQIVDTCSVNGASFDLVNSRTGVYTKIFKNMSLYSRQNGPLAITVWAMDNLQFRNVAVRTFYAFYDSAGVKNADAKVSFVIPLEDSVTYRNADIVVTGTAENYRTQTMIVRITVNDSVSGDYKTIQGQSGTWVWQLHLRVGRNQVVATAYSIDNVFMAADTASILFDPNFSDTIKPMIWSVTTAGGAQADGFTTGNAAETLTIVAFDEGSGIKSVLINGAPAQPVNPNGYIWTAMTGPLTHQIKGNNITVRAIDQMNNYYEEPIVIYKNSLPVLVPTTMPRSFCVDTSYSLRLASFDADNDPVTFQWVHTPKGMTTTADGGFSWKPAAIAIGTDSMVVHLLDGYGQTPDTVFYFSINDCSQAHTPVHFTTTEQDFPPLLQADADSMAVILAIDKQPSGYTPVYSARFTDRDESIEVNAASPLVAWRPAEADTGSRRLMVTVGDGTIGFDTLYPAIRVVRRNQYPCSLSWTSSMALTAMGELDLTGATRADTLNFTIHDLDDPLTEKYTVTVMQNGIRTVQVMDNRAFLIAISPNSSKTRDTLHVSISDQTKTSDSMTLYILYKTNQYSVRLQLNTTASGAGVMTNQCGFPVLIRLTGSNFDFSRAQGSGQNVIFTKTSGAVLPHEIEQWDSLARTAAIWVKVDTVYGNDSAHSIVLNCGGGVGSTSDPHAVFDTANGFQSVWHFSEGTNSIAQDATVNAYNGTPSGAPTDTTGVIGHAKMFNGQSSYFAMSNTANGKLNFPQGGLYTISAWVNTNILDANYRYIISKGDKQYGMEISNTNQWEFFDFDNLLGWQYEISPAVAQTWKYIVGVRNGPNQYLYVDGVLVSGTISTGSTTGRIESNNVTIGRMSESATRFFNGKIDEACMANVPRSADWIRLCYMNQKPQDALVRFR
jgi:Domain of unknown function (DUF2341).